MSMRRLTAGRPPLMARRLRISPLSQFIGATPTNAATCFELSVPSSAIRPTSPAAAINPMPGIEEDLESLRKFRIVGYHDADRLLEPFEVRGAGTELDP